MWLAAWLSFATLAPIAYYVYIGIQPASRPNDDDDFFLCDRSISANDFANTSIGYALQMTAVLLFIDWGVRYGIGAFWAPLFWGIGFLFLYLLIPYLGPFLSPNRDWTLHGFLQSQYNSRLLQFLATLATIIGLWGTMMVEIDYATTVYAPFISNNISLYVLGLLFMCAALAYICYGGYKSEVRTERVQVPLAYVTFLLVIILSILNTYFQGYHTLFWCLSIALLILLGLMLFARHGGADGAPVGTLSLVPAFGMFMQLGCMLFVMLLQHPHAPHSESLPALMPSLTEQVNAQGLLILISLFVANAFWQIVDVSSWQRIASIKLSDGETPAIRFKPLRQGLWRVMIESPVSWALGIIFGIAIHHSSAIAITAAPDAAFGQFVSNLESGNSAYLFLGTFSWLVYPVLVAAVVAIMLSTVGGLLSAITFTAYKDLPPYTAQPSLKRARLYTVGIAIFGAVLYYWLRHSIGVSIQGVLFSVYSSQLILLPTVIAALFPRYRSLPAALASIGIGLSAMLLSIILTADFPDLSNLPPLIAVGCASIVYVVMVWFRRPALSA